MEASTSEGALCVDRNPLLTPCSEGFLAPVVWLDHPPASLPIPLVPGAEEELPSDEEVARWRTRGSARRPAGQDLEASSPDRISNVVLVGPGGSGKTTLVETLLAAAGAITRAGSVRDGTTVCDFEDSEHAHDRSISLAVAPLVHEGIKVNLIDTPGYADFVGELRAGLRAADCALFVIAANEGVDDAHPGAVARVRRRRRCRAR